MLLGHWIIQYNTERLALRVAACEGCGRNAYMLLLKNQS